jgi:hypothetical protein
MVKYYILYATLSSAQNDVPKLSPSLGTVLIQNVGQAAARACSRVQRPHLGRAASPRHRVTRCACYRRAPPPPPISRFSCCCSCWCIESCSWVGESSTPPPSSLDSGWTSLQPTAAKHAKHRGENAVRLRMLSPPPSGPHGQYLLAPSPWQRPRQLRSGGAQVSGLPEVGFGVTTSRGGRDIRLRPL